MNMTTMGWLFLAVGFVPWRVVRQQGRKGKGRQRQSWGSLIIQATFWQLYVQRDAQGHRWQLTLPLIARLKSSIWVALQDLIKDGQETSHWR